MKKLLILSVLLFACLCAFGQETRTFFGLVADEDGMPLYGATLKVQNVNAPFKTDRAGRFEIKVPLSAREMTAFCEGYVESTVGLTGSFILIIMKKPEQVSSVSEITPREAVAAAAAVTVTGTPAAGETSSSATEVSSGKADKSDARQAAEDRKTAMRKAGKGLMQSIDLSYSYSFGRGRMVYENIGEEVYGSLHPIELTYSIGYNFSRLFALYGGVGVSYDICNFLMKDDICRDLYKADDYSPLDIPAFIGMRFSFCEGSVHPYLLLQGGIYTMATIRGHLTPDAEIGFGLRCDLRDRMGFNLVFSASTPLWPHFDRDGFRGYPITVVPSVKFGFCF